MSELSKDIIKDFTRLTNPEQLKLDLLNDLDKVWKDHPDSPKSEHRVQIKTIVGMLADLATDRLKGLNTSREEGWLNTAMDNYNFGDESRAYEIKRDIANTFEARFNAVAKALQASGESILKATIKAAL